MSIPLGQKGSFKQRGYVPPPRVHPQLKKERDVEVEACKKKYEELSQQYRESAEYRAIKDKKRKQYYKDNREDILHRARTRRQANMPL
jgi:hypothetical protein